MIFFRRSHPFDPNWDMSPALRWRIWTSGWRGMIVLFFLIALPLLLWKGPSAYGQAKLWRAGVLIAQADSDLLAGDFKGAATSLRQATALVQRHPLTLRAVVRYQVAARDPAVLATYQALMETGEATPDDKLSMARLAFELGQAETAAPLLAQLATVPSLRATPLLLALQAEQAAHRGQWSTALGLARQASTSPGPAADQGHAQSVLARLLLIAPAPTAEATRALRSDGITQLFTLALRADKAALAALERLVSLAQDPQFNALFQDREVQAVIDTAELHPLATPALVVSAWNLQLAATPAQKAEVARQFHAKFQHTASAPLRLEAARWLNQKGQHEEARAMAAPSRQDSTDWLLVYLDATAALGHWSEVLAALNSEPQSAALAPAVRQLLALRAAQQSQRAPDTTAAWQDIHTALRHAPMNDRLYVATYAEKTGFLAEAEKVYRRALERDDEGAAPGEKLGRPRRLACYLGQLRCATGTKSLDEIALLTGRLAAEFPEMDEVQNDHAYLQLLAGQDIATATRTAARLSQQRPDMLAYRTTHALGLLRQGKLAAAELYDGWAIDWTTAPARYRAVYVAVMRSAGRGEEARHVAASLTAESSLWPGERRLLLPP